MNCHFVFFCGSPSSLHLSERTVLLLEVLFTLLYAGIVGYLFAIRHKKTLRNLLVVLIGVVLFEIMIDPMVTNAGLSRWTYYYHDLSYIITFGWVLIVAISISLVDHHLKHLSTLKRFWLTLCVIDAITLPVEIFLVSAGVRIYSAGLLATSAGAMIPFSSVPLEVAFAIPMYFALVLGFTKYWEWMLDGK